jgi:hypothetical protein
MNCQKGYHPRVSLDLQAKREMTRKTPITFRHTNKLWKTCRHSPGMKCDSLCPTSSSLTQKKVVEDYSNLVVKIDDAAILFN